MKKKKINNMKYLLRKLTTYGTNSLPELKVKKEKN